MARIAVIGGGYVGLVSSACLAKLGHSVTCIEINQERLCTLKRAVLPIHEPGLDELVNEGLASARLDFTDNYTSVIPSMEFVFIAVNTPPLSDGQPDTSHVFKAARSVIQHAPRGLRIVIKSTVPVGTGDEIAAMVRDEYLDDVSVVSNPEFLRQGTAVSDFLLPDRIVIGASDRLQAEAVRALFDSIPGPVILCSRRSAELAKYAANALLATRISFMNEVAGLAESLQADIEEITEILRADPRIGPSYLRAGLGWGGSCFPKDVQALAWLAREAGFQSSIAESAYTANRRQRDLAFERIWATLPEPASSTVGVLGLAFKPDTDDLRESPALDVINRLMAGGVRIRAHDPSAMENARRQLSDVAFCEDAYQVAEGSDVLFLATEWREYLGLDWSRIGPLMRGATVFDGRHVLDRERLLELGFKYLSFGRFAEPASQELRGLGELVHEG